MDGRAPDLQFDGFTLDRTRRQLRRGDELLPVTGKAFDLLVYLTANAGRPLEKAELLQAVWPDSFVEESNLTQNVFLLRKILGSGPGSPITTLPGRGYLFTAPVTEVLPERAAVAVPMAPAMMEATRTRVVLEEETEEHISAWRSPWVLSLTGAGLVLLGIASWLGWQRWEDYTSGPPVQAVMASFSSNTGDAVLDHTLEDALRIDLAQSPFVTVVSPATVRRTLVEMAHKPDEVLTPALAHDVCERTGSQVVLEAEVAKTGSHYLMTTQATSCVDGAIVAADRREATSATELPAAIQKIGATLRHGLGESRRSIARFNTPLYPMVTPSLEALEDYSQSFRLAQQGKFPEAISLLKQAVSLDPNFATAYMDLGTYSSNMSDFQAHRNYLRKAYELRDHATEPARRGVLSQDDAVITGDLHQSVRDIQAWTEMYPHNVQAFAALSQVYRELERPVESIAAAKRAIALSPNFSVLYYGLASDQVQAGDIAGAKATIALANQRGYDTDLIHMVLCRIAYFTHDDPLLQQQVAWAAAHPGSVYTVYTQARTVQNDGRFKASRDLFATVAHMLQESGQSGVSPIFDQEAAVGYLLLDDPEDGRALAHTDFKTEDSQETGMVLSGLGETAAATADLERHLHDAPQGTLWNHLRGPIIKARILLHENRRQEALAALDAAAEFMDYDLDVRYTRALALHALHRLPEAEGDLRFVLGHASQDAVSSVIPAAEFELGAVLKDEVRSAEAKQAFQVFLGHWSKADQDAVLYRRAFAEIRGQKLEGKSLRQ